MNTKMKIIISIAIFVVAFVGVLLLYNNLSSNFEPDNLADTTSQSTDAKNDNNKNDENVDYSAPDFVVENENGSEVTLSGFFGKPIVLNMWASWCSPCKQEMPFFEEAYKENEDIQFMMVNMTSGDSKGDAKKLIEELGYTFPVFYDTDGMAASVYGASSLPMTIFIDENGDLVTYAVGALNKEQLQQGIDMIK